jgi:hypothetical protein
MAKVAKHKTMEEKTNTAIDWTKNSHVKPLITKNSKATKIPATTEMRQIFATFFSCASLNAAFNDFFMASTSKLNYL